MRWTGMPEMHAAYKISSTVMPVPALRMVPRRALALLRMTMRPDDNAPKRIRLGFTSLTVGACLVFRKCSQIFTTMVTSA